MEVPDTALGVGLPAPHAGVSDPALTLEASSRVGAQLLIKFVEAAKPSVGPAARLLSGPADGRLDRGCGPLSPARPPPSGMPSKSRTSP